MPKNFRLFAATPGRGFNFKITFSVLVLLLLSLTLMACMEDVPTSSGDTLPFNLTPTATARPPFVAANNVTPPTTSQPADKTVVALIATSTPLPTIAPTFSPAPPTLPPTPIVVATPAAPQQGFFGADDLGVSSWIASGISWSPQGDQLVLHVIGQGQDNSYYYLIKPPNSHVAGYKLANGTFGTINWSPDGRYFSYVDKDAAGNVGPVKIVDTLNAPATPRQVFKGPCTSAIWLKDGKLTATCGLAVYGYLPGNPIDQPETLFKLTGDHFPNSNVPLVVLTQAVPSPDGTQLALLALRRTNVQTTQTEAGIYNLVTKAFVLIDHNNRPVIFLPTSTWTADSKYIVLRNFTDDYAVPYTFDYYLADASKGRIQDNLTRSNPTCDPLLTKTECQGINPSTMQSDQIFFSPDGKRYLFTAQRFVSEPAKDLQSAYRLYDSALGTNKINQVLEEPVGDKIENMVWLPGNHYFYSHTLAKGVARAIYDGKPLDLKLANDKAALFYISPIGNWLASIEKIADTKADVQFQLRLIPANLK